MSVYRRTSYKRSAAVLGVTMVTAKLIGAVYKLPLLNILGDAGTTHFQVTYQIYAVLLAISTTGIPVALSSLVSSALARDRPSQAKRLFSVALPAFGLLGAVLSLVMFCFAGGIAALIGDKEAAPGIRVLSPAVLLVCLISVYEGYAQGQRDTTPTSVKQFTEVLCKLVIGLSVAWWLLNSGFGPPIIAAGAITGVPVGLLVTLVLLAVYKKKRDAMAWGAPGMVRYDQPDRRKKTFYDIMKISIPITMASALMSLLTLADMAVVLDRLQAAAGVSEDMADTLYGVYSKGLTLMILPSALIVPVSVGIIPAVTAALALNRHRRARQITGTALKLTSVLAMPAAAGLSVLSYPIFKVLYWNSNENGPVCLSILGIASYFVCMQLVTTAILHASGREKMPALTVLAGGGAQLVVDYLLVSRPEIHIVGSPVGSVVCYLIITAINLAAIYRKAEDKPDYRGLFVKPALCSAVMAAGARAVYALLYRPLTAIDGGGRLSMALSLAGTIAVAAAIYGLLAVTTKTVTREDIVVLPRGRMIADMFKIK